MSEQTQVPFDGEMKLLGIYIISLKHAQGCLKEVCDLKIWLLHPIN